MELSVITATRQRPAFLAHCLEQFRNQSTGGLRCEHVVVSDGPDAMARELARRVKARYLELDVPLGQWGAFAKDLGVQQARGEYVCFWDDDNIYFPHALATLYASAVGTDVGVARTGHRLRRRPGLTTLPRRWEGRFVKGDIDTMCVCVRTELARTERWGQETNEPGTDYHWLHRLQVRGASIRYVPIVIGAHV